MSKEVFVDEENMLLQYILEKGGVNAKPAMLSIGDIHIHLPNQILVVKVLTGREILAMAKERSINAFLFHMEMAGNPVILVNTRDVENPRERFLVIAQIAKMAFYHKTVVIPYEYDEDIAEIVKFILSVEKIENKRPKPKYATMTPRDWAIYVLTAFPDIGPKKAEHLLKTEGSLRGALMKLIMEGAGGKKVQEVLNYEEKTVDIGVGDVEDVPQSEENLEPRDRVQT